MVQLADASVIHLRGAGSNLGLYKKYFKVLFVAHLNSNL
jgi:hypothetical protein